MSIHTPEWWNNPTVRLREVQTIVKVKQEWDSAWLIAGHYRPSNLHCLPERHRRRQHIHHPDPNKDGEPLVFPSTGSFAAPDSLIGPACKLILAAV
jgi:hypothetical protein